MKKPRRAGKTGARPRELVVVGRMADHQPKQRTCLSCGEGFASLGPGNRVCGRCKFVRTTKQWSKWDDRG